MTVQCRATTRTGAPCGGTATAQHGLCWAHDPANREQRRRNASRGGKGRPTRELADVKQRLLELAEQVLAGRVDRADAAVAGQLFNTFLRAVAVEVKVKEQTELEERLTELEEQQPDKNTGGGYRNWHR